MGDDTKKDNNNSNFTAATTSNPTADPVSNTQQQDVPTQQPTDAPSITSAASPTTFPQNSLGSDTSSTGQPTTQVVTDNTNSSPVTTVITSPHAPQKYGGKKILATIFGLLLVVGGVISGVALVQRQQNISEQAVTPDYDAQCSEVKVYDTNWNELSAVDLETLTEGAVVRFTVSGITSTGSFDKAKFNINGNLSPEITTKKPGTEEFYYEYTIPAGVTDFTVKGQVHHSVWGWI